MVKTKAQYNIIVGQEINGNVLDYFIDVPKQQASLRSMNICISYNQILVSNNILKGDIDKFMLSINQRKRHLNICLGNLHCFIY